MTVRLMLGVAFVANIVVLVVCTANKCPPFEQWDKCANAVCRANFCNQKGLPVPCPAVSKCVPGCLCQNNYLREESGVCVPEEDCKPNPCPLNEVLSNCTQAVCRTQNCTDRGKPVACPLVAEGDCEQGCVCKEGYLRVEDGLYCVPEGQCNANKCPRFEVWDDCANAACRAENCTQKGLPLICPGVSECVQGCLCQNNYLRDESGVCVPEEDCKPNPCPLNEELSNCTQAVCRTQNCTDRGKPVACPLVAEGDCEEGCVCKEGYLRVEDGLYCVPEGQCNANKCPRFEVWDDCANAACRAENCTQKGLPLICPAVSECVQGCLCQNNYLRDESGVCVPEEDCKPNPCPPNEELSNCTQAVCRTQNCSDRGNPVACPLVAEGVCEEGCVCKEGYLRVEDGLYCVPEGQCNANKCPRFEVWDDCANAACRAENCTQKGLPLICPAVSECVQGCLCQNNYLRDESGVCVPEENCKPNRCPLNEELSNCTQAVCRTQNCTDRGKPVACPLVAEGDCEEGCVCKEGYLRVEDGLYCVPEGQCNGPMCPNAHEEYMRIPIDEMKVV